MKKARVCIIGGGVCGRASASILREAGVEVDIYDKGRGGCGRVATRRSNESGCAFDTGAQYFTIGKPDQHDWFHPALEQRKIAEWKLNLGVSQDGKGFKMLEGKLGPKRYVALPGMSALGNAIDPKGVGNIKFGQRVTKITRDDAGKWFVKVEGKEQEQQGPYDATIVTAPPVQAAALLEDWQLGQYLQARIKKDGPFADVVPCHVMMVEFPVDQFKSPVDGLFVNGGWLGEGGWIAKDSSKPGRPDEKDTGFQAFVVQAGPQTTLDHLESTEEELRQPFLQAFYDALDLDPVSTQPSRVSFKRWLYARTIQNLSPNAESFLVDNNHPDLLFVSANCSDGKVENCLFSGYDAAHNLLKSLSNQDQIMSKQ